MKKSCLPFLFLGVFFFSSTAEGTEWVLLYELAEGHGSFRYYDKSSITYPTRGAVQVQTKTTYSERGITDVINYRKKIGLSTTGWEKLSHTIEVMTIFCKTKEVSLVSMSSYAAQGKTLESYTFNKMEQAQKMPADGLIEPIYRALCTGASVGANEALTGDLAWKQYRFENAKLSVYLPFALKNTNMSPIGEKIRYGQNYQGSNDRLMVNLSYTELKAEHKFVLEEMFSSGLENLKRGKDMKIFSHKYEELKYGKYPAGKMIVEYGSDSIKVTSELVYILVAPNKCWFLSNSYASGNAKSKEVSDKILNSIKLK